MDEIVTRRRRRSSYRLVPRWATPRRTIALLLSVVVLAGGTYTYGIASSLARLTHRNLIDTITQGIGGLANRVIPQQAVDVVPRTNIAVYGFGGGTHDGAYLSDSIMIVSIQKLAGRPVQVAEMSIPRDWYVPIGLGNNQTAWGRINEAYSSGVSGAPHHSDVYSGPLGGGALADAEIEKLFGIHIDHFVGIDFTAFRTAVDSVGGVDVNVPDNFVDYQYPSDSCESGLQAPCYDTTVRFTQGMQHMDGRRALVFARSRHAVGPEGSDFARSRRQQLIIQSLKVKASGFGLLTNGAALLNSLSADLATDISDLGQFSSLYDLLKTVDTSAIEHVSIDDQNFLYECGYPAACSAAYIYAHDTTYATLHHFAQNILPSPDALAQKAPVTVYDGSGRGEGADGRWSSLLSMMTFRASAGGMTRHVQSTTHVIDNSGGRDAATAAWLADYFGVTVEQPAVVPTPAPLGRSASSPSPSSDNGVIVLLGSDEERSFFDASGQNPNNGETSSSRYGTNGGGGAAPYVPTYPPATRRPVATPGSTGTPARRRTASAVPAATPSAPAILPPTAP